MTRLIDDCRSAFEKWYRSNVVVDEMQVSRNMIYYRDTQQDSWVAWQASWEYRQKKIDDMEDTMMAMSDSLGAMANS